MRLLSVLFILALSVSVTAQPIVIPRRLPAKPISRCALTRLQIRNATNRDAPIVRDSATVITGGQFVDQIKWEIAGAYELGGVRIYLAGKPQLIIGIEPGAIYWIPDLSGDYSCGLQVVTPSSSYRLNFSAVDVYPSIRLADAPDSELYRNKIPLGFWGIVVSGLILGPLDLSPVPVSTIPGFPTIVRVQGTGFRYADSVRVYLGGVECLVLGYQHSTFSVGQDEIAFVVPPELVGAGLVQLTLFVGVVTSNPAQFYLGAAFP